jgi:hypothetical protein
MAFQCMVVQALPGQGMFLQGMPIQAMVVSSAQCLIIIVVMVAFFYYLPMSMIVCNGNLTKV